ncbi:MAG TPA: transposase [Psychromonas sp.]
MSKPFTDIDGNALEALIARVTEAKDNNLALSPQDCQLLLDALVTLASMQDRLANHDVTVHKLRKLLGIEKSSEKRADVSKQPKGALKKKKPQNHSEEGFAPVKPRVVMHSLQDLKKGDNCPECLTGKVYKTDPGSLLRITGHSPFRPEQHVMERFRCNSCGAYFTAPLPDDVLSDGSAKQKYGYSARALMAIYKYFAGLPFYRQGSIQQLLGVKMTASSVFDQVERVCDAIYPVYQTLFNLAADAAHYYLDDTTHRILDQTSIEKKVRNSDKTQLRTGVYTSGVIATLADNRHIVLFETNIGHAGEFIDSILHKRGQYRAKPIIMSDALPSNHPTVREAVISLCNSHARRQFVDVINHFPDEVDYILERYGQIWTNEHRVVEQNLTATQRLEYHQTHSQPVMAEIKEWGETHLSDGTVEENSGLGKAIRYFIKHYAGLSCFCSLEGVKIDNNQIEAMLKIVVRDRKNAMFHKTLLGATIGDVVTSMIATGSEAGINVFDYFTVLQRDKEKVKATPENYLPWNYLENS